MYPTRPLHITCCRFILLLSLICTFFSCRLTPAYPDHPSWTDSIADKVSQLQDEVPERAMPYLDSVYNVTPCRGTGDLWRKYRLKIGFYSNVKPDGILRWQYIDSMFRLLEGRESKYKFEYAHSLYEKASAFQAEKKFTQAFDSYFDGRNFAQQNLDTCSLTDFSNSLGLICYAKEEFLKAVPYLLDAYQQAISCKPATNAFYYQFILPQGVLNTIALCYERAHKPDSAVHYYQQALQFVKAKKTSWPEKNDFIDLATGVIEGNLGGAFVRLRNFNEAEKHLRESIRINDKEGFAIEDAQTAKTKLADLYLKFDHYKQTDSLLGELEKDILSGRGKSLENDQVVGKWINLKWKYAEKTNNIPLAYYYMKRYHAFDDSMRKVKSALNQSDMDQAFEEHQHRFEVEMLQKNNQIKTAYLFGTAAILLMAIIIALITWFHLKRSRKHIATLRDTNAQKKTMVAALLQSEKDNSKIMKVVAHDLRNPIGAIVSAATMMIDDNTAIADNKTMWKLVKTAGDNSLKLVNDLLRVKVQELPKEPVDLEALIHYCVELLQHKIQAKKQFLEVSTVPVTLALHQDSLWRVIANLIGNASKFSPAGSTILVTLNKTDDGILVMVKDYGIGIPDNLKSKVFDVVAEAQRAGTEGEESFGIGLSVSRQIVEQQGGKIWFDSRENAGTTFYILFPDTTV